MKLREVSPVYQLDQISESTKVMRGGEMRGKGIMGTLTEPELGGKAGGLELFGDENTRLPGGVIQNRSSLIERGAGGSSDHEGFHSSLSSGKAWAEKTSGLHKRGREWKPIGDV